MWMPSFLRNYPQLKVSGHQGVFERSRRLVHVSLKTATCIHVDEQQSRAIKCLAHAIEYLDDTKPFSAERTPRLTAVEQSITLLRTCNREVFLSCSTESQRNAVMAWTGTLTTSHDHHAEWTSC